MGRLLRHRRPGHLLHRERPHLQGWSQGLQERDVVPLLRRRRAPGRPGISAGQEEEQHQLHVLDVRVLAEGRQRRGAVGDQYSQGGHRQSRRRVVQPSAQQAKQGRHQLHEGRHQRQAIRPQDPPGRAEYADRDPRRPQRHDGHHAGRLGRLAQGLRLCGVHTVHRPGEGGVTVHGLGGAIIGTADATPDYLVAVQLGQHAHDGGPLHALPVALEEPRPHGEEPRGRQRRGVQGPQAGPRHRHVPEQVVVHR
mmetsp:Transcript_21940/g.62264  ORF Transcript_21940/g.62264 Transcript_21940/m.62264 type:complete len:252 (-) Transcript_21940:704-1459(-)